MAIEDVFTMLANGTYPETLPTPISDEAFALLKTDLPFREKWPQIQILSEQARKVGGEDANRFKWVIESIYAGATADDIRIMHGDEV